MAEPINTNHYDNYLVRFIKEAIANSDGSNYGISLYLSEIKIGRWFVPHKLEQKRALKDAQIAFDEHRHWPRNIILSHLGVTLEE
jgi:hypothetical protein